MKYFPRALATTLLFSLVASSVMADDWPNWLGPDRNGIVDRDAIEPNFVKDGLNIVWQKQIGVGYSSIAVSLGKAYTAGWKDGKTTFHCFNADTGDEVWSHTFKSPKFDSMNEGGPASTAAILGGRVYFLSRGGILFCFDADNGRVIWDRDLGKDFRLKTPNWGFSGSPVLLGRELIIDVGRVLALKTSDGSTIWQTDDYTPAYSTPTTFQYKGRSYLAAFPGDGLIIIEQRTGKVVAKHDFVNRYRINAATPIVKDNEIFISSGYNMGCVLLRFEGRRLRVVWENKDMRNQMPTCVLVDGHLYGFDDKQLKCLRWSDGKEMWNKRGLGQGTVIAAGQTLLVQSDKGKIMTAPASSRGFDPIGEAQSIQEQKVWITPTIANGKVYCRGSKGSIVCIDASQ